MKWAIFEDFVTFCDVAIRHFLHRKWAARAKKNIFFEKMIGRDAFCRKIVSDRENSKSFSTKIVVLDMEFVEVAGPL